MADDVTTKIFELVQALGEVAVDAKLTLEIGEKARKQAVLGGNSCQVPSRELLVGSNTLERLYASTDSLRSSSGTSRVLYALSHSKKSSGEYEAPAIMISGHFPFEFDYLTCMAAALEIPWKQNKLSNTWWIKSLVAALLPSEKEQLQHAPVLTLDEFNSLGAEREIVLFAESLSRYVYGKGLTVIFVTENESAAEEICKCNAWQKVGPYPGMTIPDRYVPPGGVDLSTYRLPPARYEWKDMS